MQADVERLLARLYCDAEFLEVFCADAYAVAKQNALSDDEAAACARMSQSDLRMAAHSFQKKRSLKKQSRKTLRFFR